MKKMALVALALVSLMACGGPTDEQKAMIGKTVIVQQGIFEIRATISNCDSVYRRTLYFNEVVVFFPDHWQDVRVQKLNYGDIYNITAKVGDGGLRSEVVKLYELSDGLWSFSPYNVRYAVEWRKKEAR